MKFKTPLAALIALALLVPLQTSATKLAAVHGINGTDLGASKAFPVDIAVNGGCALTDVTFGAITDFIELGTGTFDIDISIADGNCGNDAVLSTRVKLRSGDFKTVVAHLDSQGGPTTTTFRDDQSIARRKNGRLTFRHAAAAPAVDITLGRNFNNAQITVSNLTNGEQELLTLRRREYKTYIAGWLSHEPLVGPIPLSATQKMNTIIYAVGTLASGTFELLVDVKPLTSQQ